MTRFKQRIKFNPPMAILLLGVATASVAIAAPDTQPEITATDSQQPNPYDMADESLKQAFSSLAILESGMTIAYNSSTATVINKKRAELDKSHPLFVNDSLEEDDLLLMQTRLSETDPQMFYVLFSEGPSADPSFYFIKINSPDKVWGELYGTALAIPGNGTAYIANRYNDTFTRRAKYIYTVTGFIEVTQPFYYVGLKTHTLAPINLYAAPDEKRPVAQLPKGSQIEVLLADSRLRRLNMRCYLIKTPFGLVGWSWVPDDQYRSKVVEGISFWGD